VKPYDLDKILATWSVRNRKIIKYGYLTLCLLNRLPRISTSRDDLLGNITQDSLFDKQVDDLWETISPQYDFAVEKTHTYLNWRYGDPRSGKYTIFQLKKRGNFSAILSYQSHTVLKPLRVGYIVDLFAVHEEEAVFPLLSKAIRFFSRRKTLTFLLLWPPIEIRWAES